MRAIKKAKLECIKTLEDIFTKGEIYNASSFEYEEYDIIDDSYCYHNVDKPTDSFFKEYFEIIPNSEEVFDKEIWLDESYYLNYDKNKVEKYSGIYNNFN